MHTDEDAIRQLVASWLDASDKVLSLMTVRRDARAGLAVTIETEGTR